MDEDLRTGLWNVLSLKVWNRWRPADAMGFKTSNTEKIETMIRRIWINYFKLPLDKCPAFDEHYTESSYEIIRQHLFTGEWWEALDLLEFLVKNTSQDLCPDLSDVLNRVLETENSAYRIVENEVTEITDEQEIQSIEDAFDSPSQGARKHFENALKLLSDRKEPDYPNSIKESISAVESACRSVSGNPKATLGDCLKAIQKNRPLHAAFKDALNKLYGYTSDEGGIRHSLSDAPPAQLSYADAKFMLVTCTAFVNYLFTRAAEDSLPLSSD